ncbi:FixH family protein [Roseospira goensis]|uniref:Nitrogen fixation protein FixH n=1 Tax=Roseospira goensis TaxID=391922 RepID=A0A7W6WK66_9PROT|nr:FixH family protein [Roseospira goensis]MBB4286021.1 nitrogen fixation protein FixH [Roseospira goensis]
MSGNPGKIRPRGWWIPYTFVLAFGVVLVANGTLLYFATTTFSGLTTRQAYVEGLAYNDKVAEEQAQEALGWIWSIDLVSTGAVAPDDPRRRATVRAEARDAAGTPLDGLDLHADIRRPTEPGLDQSVALAPVGPGAYEVTVLLPKPGQWDVMFTAQRGDDTYKLRRRLRTD